MLIMCISTASGAATIAVDKTNLRTTFPDPVMSWLGAIMPRNISVTEGVCSASCRRCARVSSTKCDLKITAPASNITRRINKDKPLLRVHSSFVIDLWRLWVLKEINIIFYIYEKTKIRRKSRSPFPINICLYFRRCRRQVVSRLPKMRGAIFRTALRTGSSTAERHHPSISRVMFQVKKFSIPV